MSSGPLGAGPPDMRRGYDAAADVAERLRFGSLVSNLAAGFVNLEPERVDYAIEDCLRLIVEALGLDRSTLFQRSGNDLVATHSWAVPGQDPFPKVWARAELPWAFERVAAGGSIVFSRLDDLPADADIDKAFMQRFGPRSNASMLVRRGMDRQLRAVLAENEELRARLGRESRDLRAQAPSLAGTPRLVGQGPSMQRM